MNDEINTLHDLEHYASLNGLLSGGTGDNRRSTLNRFCEVNNLDKNSSAPDVLQNPDLHEHYLRVFLTDATARAQKSNLNWWGKFFTKLEDEGGTFADALRAAIEHAAVSSIYQLARDARIRESSINNWLRGKCVPSLASLAGLRRLEEVLGDTTLTARIQFDRGHTIRSLCPKRFFPERYQGHDKMSLRIREQVAEHMLVEPLKFLEMDEEGRSEIIHRLCEELGRELPGSSGRTQQDVLYRHTSDAWDPNLKAAFDAFATFASSVKVAGGFERYGRVHRDSTIEFYERQLASFFGFCIADPDCADPWLRGAGLDPARLHLTLLACTALFDEYTQFHLNRGNKLAGLKGIVTLAAKLLHPNTGYLTQKRSLQRTLFDHPALAIFRTPEEVIQDDDESPLRVGELLARPGESWLTLCARAFAYYRKLSKELGNDPRAGFDRIWPLVIAPDQLPLHYIWNMIEEMQAHNRRANRPGSLAYSLLHRDITLIALTTCMPLRSKHWHRLVVEEDQGQGRIFFDGEHYICQIPHTEFKNWSSQEVFPNGRPYQAVLLPAVAEIYREWLELHRPRLMRQGNHPYLLVNRAGSPMNYEAPSGLFWRITEKFIAEGALLGTGVLGVKPFRIHRMRQIVASHLVREDKTYTRGAFALADSEAMVKQTYSWLTDADRALFVLEGLEQSWARYERSREGR